MKPRTSTGTRRMATALLPSVLLLAAVPAAAIVEPGGSPLADKLFAESDFYISNYGLQLGELPPNKAVELQADLDALGSPLGAFYDARGDVWHSLIMAHPLVPGSGVGNGLTWADLGISAPADDAAYKDALLQAFRDYLAVNQAALGIDPAELEASPTVGVHDKRRLAHVWAERTVDGVPVRFNSLTATINSGNLVLYGTNFWGAIDVSTAPTISSAQAEAVVAQHLSPYSISGTVRGTHLELIPQANGGAPDPLDIGNGYRYRLTWVVTVTVAGDHGTYEGVVDAHSGELLAVTDLNQYLVRRTYGGIYPVSNDGLCQAQDCSLGGIPDGIEQPRHPMPFAFVTLADGSTVTTNTAGLGDFDGGFSTDLSGPYVFINDNCGFIDEATVCTDLDLGTSGGTDCTTPDFSDSPGNTHSARTGFYELNRQIEGFRSRIEPGDPAFAFLNAVQVRSNMNIPNTCNAFFTPATPSINFYIEGDHSSGNFRCRNTGEIAAVFDHEWGHYLDFADGNGLSSPSEAYADIAGITRLGDTCFGRGFFKQGLNPPTAENGLFCSGFGDPCLACTGVREDDFLKVQSQRPHGVDWAAGNDPPGGCTTPQPVPIPAPGLQSAPCGGSVHCNGIIVGEAVVDLMSRDLRCMDAGGWENVPGDGSGPVKGGRCLGGAAPTLDANTALELTTLMFVHAKGNIGFWFVCNNQVGGCNADSGYHQFLAADDDNGTFADGTPHHEAIFAAFDRHQIACPASAPPPVNASCGLGALTPGRVTGLTATPGVNAVSLDWTDTPGAVEYWVYRTEGVFGCEFGKKRIAVLNAVTDGSQYTDTGADNPLEGDPLTTTEGLLDGLEYFYTVLAVGTPGCIGQMAECASAIPDAPGGGFGGGPSIALEQGDLTITSSVDSPPDVYLDNCEEATLEFTVANNGAVDLTNVQVVDIRPVSHPETEILTGLPIALGDLGNVCDTPGSFAASGFDFRPRGMSFDETLTFEVDVAADGGFLQTGSLFVDQVESDFVQQASILFDFESGEQDWTPFIGTFVRTNEGLGGAPTPSPGTFYMRSSQVQSAQCDVVRSPVLRLTPDSTLSLYNQFVIEPESFAPYDRANVSLVDAATGQQFTIEPDGGARPYNTPGGDGFGSCVTQNEAGWVGLGSDWLDATWSSTALQQAVGTIPSDGREYLIEVAYGTDAIIEGTGFQFDQVTATDVFARGPDQASDVCTDPRVCREIDDSDPSIEYRRGWHRRVDSRASGGGFHRRMGNGGASSAVRVEFDGDEVTYFYVKSDRGGTADVSIDGVFVETVSYGPGQSGPENPTFGHHRTYSDLGSGRHELLIEHRGGAVYVDGFAFDCGDPAAGADPAAAGFSSETEVGSASSSEGPVIVRTVEVGPDDQDVSVVVEGSLVPLTVRLLDPLGGLLATGGALLPDGAVSGVEADVAEPGTYTVEVLNEPGAFSHIEISTARTVRRP